MLTIGDAGMAGPHVGSPAPGVYPHLGSPTQGVYPHVGSPTQGVTCSLAQGVTDSSVRGVLSCHFVVGLPETNASRNRVFTH